jgi:hypothetical protein
VEKALVAHTYNPGYSGTIDQEDRSSKSAQQIVCKTLSQKTLSQKIRLMDWLKVKVLSSSPSTTKKKKKRKEKKKVE